MCTYQMASMCTPKLEPLTMVSSDKQFFNVSSPHPLNYVAYSLLVGLATVADWSSSLIADRVPPAAGNVYDGDQTSVDVDYQASTSRLCITFNGFHRAVEYAWGVSATPGGSDILSRALSATEIANKRACTDGLSLQTNTMYYSTITVQNALGLSQTVTSDGG